MTSILEVSGICKRFGGLKALEDVTFAVSQGTITSLIGPNGAGKTTMFNVIAGTIQPDTGHVLFNKEDITSLRPYQVCGKGISRTYQLKNVFPNLSVFDNVLSGMYKEPGKLKHKHSRVFEILEFVGLREKATAIVANVSPLEAKLVELGRAIATNAKLLLLDELIGGLIPAETEQICHAAERLRESGYTILQVGHEMAPIMRTSDWIVVLSKGEKLAEGTPDQIRQNADVQAVYLESGGDADD
ncbi:ABC transporter ATP-binding protein [Candidatus Bipolaricaulota bacterium]|nr:ABC transporter ATP-binding protein [Candidatus Bipolaricaulota bacterium]